MVGFWLHPTPDYAGGVNCSQATQQSSPQPLHLPTFASARVEPTTSNRDSAPQKRCATPTSDPVVAPDLNGCHTEEK